MNFVNPATDSRTHSHPAAVDVRPPSRGRPSLGATHHGKAHHMETPDKSDQGYPEEQPDEVAGGDEGSQQGSRDKGAEEQAPDNEDGTATGNPNAAG